MKVHSCVATFTNTELSTEVEKKRPRVQFFTVGSGSTRRVYDRIPGLPAEDRAHTDALVRVQPRVKIGELKIQ